MSNNKARKYTSPILEELMSEITPEEMKATEEKMLQELNKQSSIEWLEQALEGTILTHEQIMQTIGLFEQAKAMHKEETCQFVSDYLDDADYGMTAEEYYDQIYGGNNE